MRKARASGDPASSDGRERLPEPFVGPQSFDPVLVYAVVGLHSSSDHLLGEAIETFISREDTERFINEVRSAILSSRATCGSRSASLTSAVLSC
jgi:hypothetical protein